MIPFDLSKPEDHMLLHQIVAAHRSEILEACNKVVAPEVGGEQTARYASALFDEIVHFLEAAKAEEPDASGLEPAPAGERVELAKLDTNVLLGACAQMRRIRTTVEQLARRSRTAVLLVGEFGTGKRQCARALHAATFPEGEFFELSVDRSAELESRINALRSLASAPAAVGLTVYVHELAGMPASMQLKLSSLLSEQGLNFRLVVSSSRALAQAAREGLVRSELAFRFPNQLELPPLRERLQDLAELSNHFASLAASRRGSAPTLLGQSALDRMRDYTWPGNLAELANVMEQLTESYGPTLIEADDLPQLDERPSGFHFHLPANGIDFAELERELLRQALVMASNNQTRAASLLGLSRDQLRYRLAKFEISTNSA